MTTSTLKIFFCWKILDLLRIGLGISLVEVSDHALELFDEMHNETRRCVQAEERGFKSPFLLGMLNNVGQGRCLSVVLHDSTKRPRWVDVELCPAWTFGNNGSAF